MFLAATLERGRETHGTSRHNNDFDPAILLTARVRRIISDRFMLLDRMDRWRVATACLASTGLIFFLLTFVPINGWLIWAFAALGGAAFLGIYTSALAILGQEHSGRGLTAGAAAFSLAYATGGVIGPVVTGPLISVVPGATFIPVAIIGLCGAAVVWLKR